MRESIGKFLEKHRIPTGLDGILNILVQDISSNRSVKEQFVANIKDKIRGIKEFSESEIVSIIEGGIDDVISDEYKQVIRERIFEINESGSKSLKAEWKKNLEKYFSGLNQTQESKLNFREKIEKGLSPEEAKDYLRAYLYLFAIPTERIPDLSPETKAEFEATFTRLISNKEFMNEILSRFDDFSEGKQRITLEFDSDLLPEEIKNDPEKFGIQKKGNKCEVFIERDKFEAKALSFSEIFFESLKIDVDAINELKQLNPQKEGLLIKAFGFAKMPAGFFMKLKDVLLGTDVLMERARKIFKGETEILKKFEMGIKLIESIIQKAKEGTLTQEDLEKVKHIKEVLNAMLKIGEEKEKDPEWRKKIMEKSKQLGKWLWENGKSIAGLLGTGFLMWGAVFSFYLPVLIADYAEKQVKSLMK